MRKILAAKPSITQLEIDYVNDAVANGWGEQCYDYIFKFKEYIKEYFGCEYVWPTSSCHGALHIALMALGVGPGDEVIVPDSTWVGSVFPITWLGGSPVFVDVLPDTWCIDPEKIVQHINNKTKAIIVVHLYGNLCEMDQIMAIGKEYNLPIIEDAAEAIGSEYKGQKAGAIADFGVFSFHGTKTITTGEGGALITNCKHIKKKITTIESQGRGDNAKFFWFDEIGLKYKMANIQAALGLAQFERAEELIKKKRDIFKLYEKNLTKLPDVSMNPEKANTKNGYWMPTLIFGHSWGMNEEKRDELIKYMNKIGISMRPFFYPVSSFPVYKNANRNIVSYSLKERGVNLPSYHEMTREDVLKVIQKIVNFRELKLYCNRKQRWNIV